MAKQYQTSTKTELTPEQFLMLTSLSMDDLKWQHTFTDNNSIVAEKWLGNNTQKITVSVNGDEVIVDSRYDSWVLTDMGRNRKAAEELLTTIQYKQPGYTPADLDDKFEQLKKESEAALKDLETRLEAGELTPSEKMAMAVGGHKVTYTLMGMNILFFAIMIINGVGIFQPEVQHLVEWGANVRLLTEGGEWWRLGSAMFMHIGIIHLLLNMYALFSIGVHLEPAMGRWKFLAAYLATGILASVTSIWWHENTASAGASGAIFGMYGVFLALLTTKFFDKNAQKALLSSIGIFVAYNLLYGMKAGIDNAAHIGGLISGLGLGYLYFFLQKTKYAKHYVVICLVLASAIAFAYLNGKQNADTAFYKVWDKVSVLEEQALAPLKNREQLSSADFMNQTRNISLPAWQKAKEEISSVNTLELTPKTLQLRNLIAEYVDLRIQFSAAVIEAERSQDWTVANELSAKIQQVLDELVAAQKL